MGQALSCTGCSGCNYGERDDPKGIVFDVGRSDLHLGFGTIGGRYQSQTTRN